MEGSLITVIGYVNLFFKMYPSNPTWLVYYCILIPLSLLVVFKVFCRNTFGNCQSCLVSALKMLCAYMRWFCGYHICQNMTGMTGDSRCCFFVMLPIINPSHPRGTSKSGCEKLSSHGIVGIIVNQCCHRYILYIYCS